MIRHKRLFVAISIFCLIFAGSTLLAQNRDRERGNGFPPAFLEIQSSFPDENLSSDDIVVYETTPPYSYIYVEEDTIFADDVTLANTGETVITKIRAWFQTNSRSEVQPLKLWIFEDLNQPAVHTQVVAESDRFQGYVMVGLSERVRVPQHFYIGFSLKGGGKADRIGFSQTVLTGVGSDNSYYIGSVDGEVLTDTLITDAPWLHKFMCLEVFTDSVNTVIPRFTSDIRCGPVPLGIHYTDASSTAPGAPITNWEWICEYGFLTVTRRDQNTYLSYVWPGINKTSLKVRNVDNEVVYTRERYIHSYDEHIALYFDGYAQYAGTNTNLFLDNYVNLADAVSLETWIHPNGWGSAAYDDSLQSGYARIFSTGLDGDFDVFLHKEGLAGYTRHSLCVALRFPDGSLSVQNTPENSIVLDQWQHVAVTYDGSTSICKVYINGEAQPLQSFFDPPNGSLADTWSLYRFVGNNISRNRPFEGRIDELRLWDHVRSEEQIQEYMNMSLSGPSAGLAGYWPFDEGSGVKAHDHSGLGNDITIGSIMNPPLWSAGVELTPVPTSVDAGAMTPDDFVDLQNYPNPFNPETTIQYRLDQPGYVSLVIYDISGKEIIQLMDKTQFAGLHQIQWNGRDAVHQLVSSGVYFSRLRVKTIAGQVIQRLNKMILMK